MADPHSISTEPPAAPGGATAVKSPPRPARQKPKRRQLPPTKVILHNDEVNTMEHVVRAITALTPLSPPQALRKMLEAHFRGKSILLVTHKERGELYVQQFNSMKITTTLEADA